MWPRRKKNSLARITLLSCMQDNLLIDYEVYQIAHEMWETLKENYGGLSTTKLRKLVMKFGNYKMRLNYTMKQHIREMKRMIRQLKTSEHVLTDEQQAETIIRSLPKSWKHMVVNMAHVGLCGAQFCLIWFDDLT